MDQEKDWQYDNSTTQFQQLPLEKELFFFFTSAAEMWTNGQTELRL